MLRAAARASKEERRPPARGSAGAEKPVTAMRPGITEGAIPPPATRGAPETAFARVISTALTGSGAGATRRAFAQAAGSRHPATSIGYGRTHVD